MFLRQTMRAYISNFRAALAFLLLLIFIFPLAGFFHSFISSGTLFLDYNLVKSDLVPFASLLVLLIVFLFFYSLLQTLIIFAIRRDLSAVKVDYYLREQMQKFTTKIMVFNVLFTIGLAWAAGLMLLYGISEAAVAALIFLISIPFLFFQQAVVVDEHSITSSLRASIGFMRKNPKQVLTTLGVGFALVVLVSLFEFAVDSVVLIGNYVTLVLVLVLVLPFMEVLKTQFYMSKFGLVSASVSLPSRKMR